MASITEKMANRTTAVLRCKVVVVGECAAKRCAREWASAPCVIPPFASGSRGPRTLSVRWGPVCAMLTRCARLNRAHRCGYGREDDAVPNEQLQGHALPQTIQHDARRGRASDARPRGGHDLRRRALRRKSNARAHSRALVTTHARPPMLTHPFPSPTRSTTSAARTFSWICARSTSPMRTTCAWCTRPSIAQASRALSTGSTSC